MDICVFEFSTYDAYYYFLVKKRYGCKRMLKNILSRAVKSLLETNTYIGIDSVAERVYEMLKKDKLLVNANKVSIHMPVVIESKDDCVLIGKELCKKVIEHNRDLWAKLWKKLRSF